MTIFKEQSLLPVSAALRRNTEFTFAKNDLCRVSGSEKRVLLWCDPPPYPDGRGCGSEQQKNPEDQGQRPLPQALEQVLRRH